MKLGASKEFTNKKISVCNAAEMLSAYLGGIFYPPHDYTHFVSKNIIVVSLLNVSESRQYRKFKIIHF